MIIEELLPSGKFAQAQLELLRMFSKQYPDKVWVEVKDLLSKYFMEKASEEMDSLFDQKGWERKSYKSGPWCTCAHLIKKDEFLEIL